ncbi:MAG: hypothetical protein CBC13_01620 [Planctomycetia bacterium TMED53]|nr:MAG: hypothetical protein CBC13_01620 [Planctomycetia bacterium TMED53]
MASPDYSIPLVDNRWRHFLQRDDSALLLERLGQDRIRHLWNWFVCDDGLRSGGVLAERAPVFDLILDKICEVIYSGPEELPAEDPFQMMQYLRNSDWAQILFGAGLMFSATWKDGAVSDPLGPSPDMGDLVEFLATEDWVIRVRDERNSGKVLDANPMEVTQVLVKMEPLLELPIEAMRKLVNRESHATQWSQDVPSEARALFFLGALAAGVEIPEIVGDKPAEYALKITL